MREWALGSTASSRRARCPSGDAAARRAARARRPRAPLARAAAPARTSSSRSSRASCSSGAGCRSRSVGVYVPRRLVSTLVMCAVPAQVAGVERIVVVTPPAGRRPRRRARPSCSGSTRSGRSAARRRSPGSRTASRASTRSSGPGNAYVNEAKLAVSRDVAIDLPAGPSEVVVLASDGADLAVVELELAAQARARAGRRVPRRRANGDLEARRRVEALAPEHLVLLGDGGGGARAARPQRRRRLRRRVVAGRGGRLRDRRQPRPADRRLGARRRRARARDVPEAGHDPAADAARASRAAARPSRRSPRPRACPRTRRRCGDEGAPAGVRRATRWAPSTDELARRAGIDPSSRPLRRQRRRRAARPRRGPGAIAGALARRQRATRTAATRSCRRRSRATRASSRRTSCSARAPTT